MLSVGCQQWEPLSSCHPQQGGCQEAGHGLMPLSAAFLPGQGPRVAYTLSHSLPASFPGWEVEPAEPADNIYQP
jgi:hypothetical protein